MTRVFVQRGSASGSSSNSSRGSHSTVTSSSRTDIQGTGFSTPLQARDEEVIQEVQEQVVDKGLEDCESSESKISKTDHIMTDSSYGSRNENSGRDISGCQKDGYLANTAESEEAKKDIGELRITEILPAEEEDSRSDSSPVTGQSSFPPPPPPPVPPPQPLATISNSRRLVSGNPNSVRIGPSRRGFMRPVSSTRTSPTASRPSSPRSHAESEGYNSSDEQGACFPCSYDDMERERQFEIDIRRTKGLEVKRMLEDGNCLFRAVADQVYGDSDYYGLTRQMCIDYVERNRDHFSQFITEGFTSYCKRKRRDKVYGNNMEIQALSEMYNRPIHIYSYSTEPINIFHGSYGTDTPPLRLSFHHGNHYNSLVDPRLPAIGAGLGFSSLQGRNVDRDQVKAAIKAQQDTQIDNALLAEGRFYSDLELTEKEMERMVMEVSRAEYLGGGAHKHKLGQKESSISDAESSSSGTRPSGSRANKPGGVGEHGLQETVLNNTMQLVLSMGFSYTQMIEAYSIFGDDVDSMVCYLLEMGSGGSRSKGKAAK